MDKDLPVAICLPARNEAASLRLLLPEIAAMNDTWAAVDLRVVVFDDGSTDGTSSLLLEYPSSSFTLWVLRSPSAVGKTPALAAAFRHARDTGADYIFMMDADGQDDPQYLPEMLEKLMSGVDVVNGRRTNRKHSWANDRYLAFSIDWSEQSQDFLYLMSTRALRDLPVQPRNISMAISTANCTGSFWLLPHGLVSDSEKFAS